MKKVLLFAAVVAMMLSACQKDEEVGGVKTTDVHFNVVDGLSDTGLKGGDINRGDIPVTVTAMELKAESVHPDVIDQYNIVDDGSGGEKPVLENVWYGTNVFKATTTAVTPPIPTTGDHKIFFGNVTYPSGVYKEVVPGLVAFTDVRPGGSWSSSEMAQELRTNVVPYVEFSGESAPVVIDDAYAANPTSINIPMSTIYGQLIVTFEFESGAGIQNYHARLFYQMPTNEAGLDYEYLKIRNNWDRFFTSENNLGTIYWSNADATAGKCLPVAVEIYSYEGGNYVPVKWIVLDIEHTKIIGGVSKWLNVVVKADAIQADLQMFTFTWDPWTNQDDLLEVE